MNNELTVKEVDFQGSTLMAVQNNIDEKVYVAVSWVCDGIGLTEKQKDAQVKKIQEDLVLKNGAKKLPLKFKGQGRDVMCIELEVLPLWLAKITITPKMLSESPEVVNNLIEYQLKAKDVLADAFIRGKKQLVPATYKEALLALVANIEEKEKLEEQLQIQQPKVESFDTFIDADGYHNIEKVGKLLGKGRNKMYEFLRENKVLKSDNIPYQRFIDAEYFVVKENTITNGSFAKVHSQTFVTPKGITYIEKLMKKNELAV